MHTHVRQAGVLPACGPSEKFLSLEAGSMIRAAEMLEERKQARAVVEHADAAR